MSKKAPILSDHETAICARFKLGREEAGITQSKLGLHIGLSRDQIANIEAARVALRFWPGWKFCTELDVNAAWLFWGDEPFRPCVNFFKEWLTPREIKDDPDILFSAGFKNIEKHYLELFRREGFKKRSGGGLRSEIKLPVHKGSAPHKQAIGILIDAWLADLSPEGRDAFVAHLCNAAQQFKISCQKK